MTTQVMNYQILFYGGSDGYQNCRAQIVLFGDDGSVAGYIRFHDPGMVFDSDTTAGNAIFMNQPSTMLPSIVDMLRNESPVYIYFAAGRAFLSTSKEPAGEGE